MDSSMYSPATTSNHPQQSFPTSYSTSCSNQPQYYSNQLASPFPSSLKQERQTPPETRHSLTNNHLQSNQFTNAGDATVTSLHNGHEWSQAAFHQSSAYPQPSERTMLASRSVPGSTTTACPLASPAHIQHVDTMREKQQWVANMQAPRTPQEHAHIPSSRSSDSLHNPVHSHYEFSPTPVYSSDQSPVNGDGGYRSSGSDVSANEYNHRVDLPDTHPIRDHQATSMHSSYDDALYGATFYTSDGSPATYMVPRTQLDQSLETHQHRATVEGHGLVTPQHMYSSGQHWDQDVAFGGRGRTMTSSSSDHGYPSSPESPHQGPHDPRLSACSSMASLRSNDCSPADAQNEYQSSVGSTSPSVRQAYPRYPHDARRKKVEMACHFCRARKLKCDGVHPTCSQCERRGQNCSWDTEVRRRGPGQRNKSKGIKSYKGNDEIAELVEIAELEGKQLGHRRPSTRSQQTRARRGSSGDDYSDDYEQPQSTFTILSSGSHSHSHSHSHSAVAPQQFEVASISASEFAGHNGQLGQQYPVFNTRNPQSMVVKAEDGGETEELWAPDPSAQPPYCSYDRTTASGNDHPHPGPSYGQPPFPYAMRQASDWPSSQSYSSSLVGAMNDPTEAIPKGVEREQRNWAMNVGHAHEATFPSHRTEQQLAESWLMEQCS
ncbi:hypothetical protein FRB93_001175 [Tulasnella sp. JGI-2019a]|nr:hypothetical protein FRB93_001175 [Tulasnella sp. JGI-2019a]